MAGRRFAEGASAHTSCAIDEKDISAKASRIIMAIVIVAQLVFCAAMIETKSGLFQDESYTLILTNGEYLTDQPEDGVIYHDGEPYRTWASVQEFLSPDFSQVIQNQIDDVHPPLHYLILAVLYSLFPGSTSPAIGLSLNAVCMCSCTVLLFFIARALRAPRWAAVLVSLFWAASPGMINCAVYLRMYALLTVWFTAAALIAVRVAVTRRCSLATAITLFIVTLLGGLTQHFFLPFAFVLYLCSGVLLIARREIASALRFAAGAILGVAAEFALFPWAYDQIFHGYRGEEALSRAADGGSFLDYLVKDWGLLNTGNAGGLLAIVALVLVVAFVLYALKGGLRADGGQGRERVIFSWAPVRAYVIVLACVVFFVVLMARVAPYPSIRYLFSIQPLLQLCFTLPLLGMLHWVAKGRRSLVVAAFLAVGVALTCLGYSYGIKYYDQENDDVAALAQENTAIVGLWNIPLMSEAFLPDALCYDTGVYFSSYESFEEFDITVLDDFTLIKQPSVDLAPYEERIKEVAPNAEITYVGDTIDDNQVYDVALNK